MGNYCITIARGYGSGGSHIAKNLSERLGIPYYDTDLLKIASEKSGIPEQSFIAANEKISDSRLKYSPKNEDEDYSFTPLPSSDPKYTSSKNLFAILAGVIRDLAGSQSCIIIGKASNHVLAGFDNVLRLNIVAPMDKCIENITRRNNVSPDEAKEKIEKIDNHRSNYIKYYTGRDWHDYRYYDMVINTGFFSENNVCEIIENIVREKFQQ
ncbi:MAG: cytidylate kinase-like family protein [Clostridiales bacterium]|nr:cytidylate kinase-like family protein [Clostridiales bacterium]